MGTTRGGTSQGAKASGGRAASVAASAAAALFFFLLPILASAANNSSPSPSRSPYPSPSYSSSSSAAPSAALSAAPSSSSPSSSSYSSSSPSSSSPSSSSPSSASSSPAPFLAAATKPNGDSLENWSLTSTIVPSESAGVVFVEPATVEEVQRVVRGGSDGGQGSSFFPSPLLTVGSGHSSGEVVSLYDPRTRKYKGTVLKTTRLRGMWLEEGSGGEKGKRPLFVRVGAGIVLADLHDWLAERGLEISMSPEIGDATVGSAAAASTKDSSVAGGDDDGDFGEGETSPSSSSRPHAPPYPPSDLYKGMGDGYLGALVRGVRYVNASGHLVDLDARRSGSGLDGGNDAAKEIRRMQGSFGLMGPIVDVLLETRPLALVETRVKIVPLEENEPDLEFARRIVKLRDDCDNMMASFNFSFPRLRAIFFTSLMMVTLFSALILSSRMTRGG